MKGILKYKNKAKEINFKDIPTLYAIMDNLEDKPTFDLHIFRTIKEVIEKYVRIRIEDDHKKQDYQLKFISEAEYKIQEQMDNDLGGL